MIKLKAVTFLVGNDGHYLYNSDHDSDYGKFHAVKDLTLNKATTLMNSLGVNWLNPKMTISAYYPA